MSRTDYCPGRALVGQPTPQTNPEQFSTEDIMAEVKYLMRLNKQHGSHPLRTIAYTKLLAVVESRA